MSLVPDCERCGKVVFTYSAEHLCPGCAAELGRDTHDPFWGDFADHPDAELRLTEARGDPFLKRRRAA